MPDVIINRCTLRVVRRGGWNWGPEPQKLLEGVIRVFPDLLARKLAELLPDEDESEIVSTIRVRIPLRMSELMSLAAELPTGAQLISGSPVSRLETRIEEALRAVIIEEIYPNAEAQTPPDRLADLTLDEEINSPGVRRAGNLFRLFLSWRERGVLSMRLAAFSSLSLEALHSTLFEHGRESLLSGAAPPDEIKRFIETEAIDTQSLPVDLKSLLRKRVEIAVEVFRRFNVVPSADVVRLSLDEALPIDRNPSNEPPTSEKPSITSKEAQLPQSEEVARQPAGRVRLPKRDTEVYVASALPFLLLGPLYRIGYLDALAATLGATELSSELSIFAMALAHKVLDPPSRGWRRSSDTIAAATAFAGLKDPLPEIALAEFSRKVSMHLSPLDAVVSETLIEGHNQLKPLLLYRTGSKPESNLLLVDVEGVFPITLSPDLKSLYPTLMEFGSPLILVPTSTADPALLKELDEEGFRFITDAPPSRGEYWRPFGLPLSGRCWTNEQSSPAASLIRAGKELANAEEEVRALWQELFEKRVSIPLATDAALEQSITLAASAALGTIAWTLWREREPVTPILALERFRDLDARVRFDNRSVQVRLPLGRRYQDLLEHSLLDDVPAVTWLDDRAIRFVGG
jgi:hypothetical protein